MTPSRSTDRQSSKPSRRNFSLQMFAALITGITRRPRRKYILLTAFLGGTSVLVGGRAPALGGDQLWQVASGGVLAASSGRVVVAGVAGVQAFDGASGNQLWQDAFLGVQAVVMDSLQVIAVGADAIRAYDASDGAVAWHSPLTSGTALASAQMKGDRLLVAGTELDATGARQLLVRAYYLWNGQIEWENQSLPANTSHPTLGGKSLSIQGARAYVSATVSNSSSLARCLVRAYDRNGGSLLWESVSNETCRANAVAAQNKQVVLAGVGGAFADDYLVRTYDAGTGELLWQDRTFVSTGFDNQAVAVDDEGKRAYVAGWVRAIPGMFNQEAFLVRAYNLKTGELDWQDQYPGSPRFCLCHAHDIAVQGGRVFAVGGGSGVSIARVYEAISGNLLWQSELPSDGSRESVAVDQGVVFAANASVLRAFSAR